MMSSKTVYRARCLRGSVALPGDKSISHRAALIAAIASGDSQLVNYSPSADCQSTLRCLRALGVSVASWPGRVHIRGCGLHGWRAPTATLDAGNSGTTMRLLAGLLAGQPFESVLTGDASLRRRPMRRIIDPLSKMGAEISAREDGRAPLRIRGTRLRPIAYQLPIASAQVKSCILLAGLLAHGTTRVTEPAVTRNHTEIMLGQFGARVEIADRTVAVTGPAELTGREYRIPGDLSSAAFLIAAALALPGSLIRLTGVGVNPTRTGFIELLQSLGAPIQWHNRRSWQDEPVADLIVRSAPLRAGRPLTIGGEMIPRLIDEIPILAVLATRIEGGVTIHDAQELRVKESDRIRTVAENLRRMGARVQEFPDGLHVPGPQSLRGALVNARGDHRIAMAFAIAGLMAAGETVIDSSEVVDISFPGFFRTLDDLVVR